MRNWIVTVLFLLGLVVFIAVLMKSASQSKNSGIVTLEKLDAVKVAVLDYAEKNNALPKSLVELNLTKEETSDYGSDLFYQVEGNKVTIISYGSDGKPGGHTFRADQRLTFSWPE